MAVTLDVGLANNVHPSDKQTVGARLAAAARTMVYGEHVPYSGPAFRQATPETSADGTTAMRVWFDHADGLSFHGKPGGFEIAGADHHFVPADVRVEGDTVLASSSALHHPVYVRYGWTSVVTEYLYNAAGLPASTFSSERVPTP
jgi:sialate O-acetylesterase